MQYYVFHLLALRDEPYQVLYLWMHSVTSVMPFGASLQLFLCCFLSFGTHKQIIWDGLHAWDAPNMCMLLWMLLIRGTVSTPFQPQFGVLCAGFNFNLWM